MNAIEQHKQQIANNGFTIVKDIFAPEDVAKIVEIINQVEATGPAFRKSYSVFAIRQFLQVVPSAQSLIFKDMLKQVIDRLFGTGFFVVKSIYFDKPELSNWFVSYHQDLTISVDKRFELAGFDSWTVKHEYYSVQPPLEILNNNFAMRIHLDDTDENNGALKVIAGSHLKGVYRPETIDWNGETETVCNVNKGGIMFMRPLLLHSSGRTLNKQKRRVIHIEFSNRQLPEPLKWAEEMATAN